MYNFYLVIHNGSDCHYVQLGPVSAEQTEAHICTHIQAISSLRERAIRDVSTAGLS